MRDLPVYLINLDGSDDRLAAATAALSSQGVTFTRVPGFDGRNTDPQDVPEYDGAAARRYMGRDLNGGEVGCYLGHLRALQTFVDEGGPFGLVLEDDMQPKPGAFATVSTFLATQPQGVSPDWYAANLGARRMKVLTEVDVLRAGNTTSRVHRAHYFPVLATAILWTRAGASAFLQSALPITCPFDIQTRRWFTGNDMGLVIDPAPFTTTGAASDIDRSHAATRRSAGGRTRLYQLRRLRRMAVDRITAMRHKALYRKPGGSSET